MFVMQGLYILDPITVGRQGLCILDLVTVGRSPEVHKINFIIIERGGGRGRGTGGGRGGGYVFNLMFNDEKFNCKLSYFNLVLFKQKTHFFANHSKSQNP